MNSRVDNFIIRQPDGSPAFASSVVLGSGLRVEETAGGLPELAGVEGEAWLDPSGGDDTARIRRALAGAGVRRVRLGPGTFTITDRITLQPGQVLAGSGPERTTLASISYPFVEMLADTAVEALGMDGVYIAGAVGGMHRVDGVLVANAEYGIDGAGRWAITNSTFRNTANPGISLINGSATVSGVLVEGCTTGMELHTMWSTRVSDVTMVGCGVGILATQVYASALNSISVSACAGGLVLSNCTSLDVTSVQLANSGGVSFTLCSSMQVSGMHLNACTGGISFTNGLSVQVTAAQLLGCAAGIRLQAVSGVSLAACTVRDGTATGAGAQGPLGIVGGRGVSVNGFHSDATATGAGAPPHVLVGNGAVEVMISGIHRINGTTPPAIEVDVSAAGGRVLFAQHNFDPARINSGGKFAAL